MKKVEKEVEKDEKKDKKENGHEVGDEENNVDNGESNDQLVDRAQHTSLNQGSNGQLGNCADDFQDQKLDQTVGCNGSVRYYPLVRWEMVAGVMHVFEVDAVSSDSDVKSGESQTDRATNREVEEETENKSAEPAPSTPTFSLHPSSEKSRVPHGTQGDSPHGTQGDSPHGTQGDSPHGTQKAVGLYPVLSFDEFVKDFTYVRTAHTRP
jgi:hypothetical protein